MMKMLSALLLGLALVTPETYAHKAHSTNQKNKAIAVPQTLDSLAPLSSLPEFSLTDQNNMNVTLDSLRGKTWIANFIYTSCGDECPIMTSKIKSLQNKLSDNQAMAFVSITTDPKHDTPKVLKSYAETHKAIGTNWFFLTGKKPIIVDLSVNGFKLPADEKSPNHSEHFVLVDAQGLIRGYYDSTEPKALTKLEQDARTVSQTK